MTPDTWGIAGPTFLLYFVGASIVVTILAAVHRRILFAGGAGTDVERLGPQQVAYLNGSGKLAVYTALGGLRAAGAIGSGADKTLVQTGPLPSGVTPLDSAVYNAAGRRIRVRDLNADQWVVAAIGQLREGLEAAGLATTARQRQTARLWAIVGAVLIVIGVARLTDGLQNDKPVGFLFLALAFAILVTIVMLARSRAKSTRTAIKGLTRLRRARNYLSPGQSPSYATYGATDAALGVALFGTASLYAMDPDFAASADIQRTTSIGGSGDASGGSSCGGGGSSCGGGGGCGGGGCGG